MMLIIIIIMEIYKHPTHERTHAYTRALTHTDTDTHTHTHSHKQQHTNNCDMQEDGNIHHGEALGEFDSH